MSKKLAMISRLPPKGATERPVDAVHFRGQVQRQGSRHRKQAERIDAKDTPDMEVREQPPARKITALHGIHQHEAGMHEKQQDAEQSQAGCWYPADLLPMSLRHRCWVRTRRTAIARSRSRFDESPVDTVTTPRFGKTLPYHPRGPEGFVSATKAGGTRFEQATLRVATPNP